MLQFKSVIQRSCPIGWYCTFEGPTEFELNSRTTIALNLPPTQKNGKAKAIFLVAAPFYRNAVMLLSVLQVYYYQCCCCWHYPCCRKIGLVGQTVHIAASWYNAMQTHMLDVGQSRIGTATREEELCNNKTPLNWKLPDRFVTALLSPFRNRIAMDWTCVGSFLCQDPESSVLRFLWTIECVGLKIYMIWGSFSLGILNPQDPQS